MAGILYWARDPGIVMPAWRNEQPKPSRTKGWDITEPGKPYPTKKTHIFEHLISLALAENQIGETKAARLMKISLATLKNACAGGL
jgi:hypothetical protein